MKSRQILPGIFSLLFLAASGQAQFYAPETEYHDKVQRLFVVELARVLAWRENLHGSNYQEVTYSVIVDSNRVTTWNLHWLDAQGKPLKGMEVRYPESLLLEGPAFYRNIFKQMWAAGSWSPLPKISEGELAQGFWNGADRAGLSREEGLAAMFELAGPQPTNSEAQYVPALAGLMGHTPLPGLAGGVTLDAMLSSRAAAWLCLGEAMVSKASAAGDRNWAPVLFLAGRQFAAFDLWTKSSAAGGSSGSNSQYYAWWDLVLRQSAARKAFLSATDPRHRPFAMPMLVYYARSQALGSTMAEVIGPLYGDEQKTIHRLYSYAPYFAQNTTIGGGRILEGAWPALFRAAWVNALQAFRPTPLDYTNYRPLLDGLARAALLRPAGEEDASLIGLKSVAPLLEMGYEQGEGKLTPVATVTARDLLNYGWEMNGVQMGSRYGFVNQNWGVPQLAKTIFNEATRDIQGQSPFFKNDLQKQVYNLQPTLFRLQMVDDLGGRVGVDIQPFSKDMNDTNAARLFFKRCWLRPYDVRWQSWTLCYAQLQNDMVQLLTRYHQECGPLSDFISLVYLADWFTPEQLARVNGLKALRKTLAEAIPVPIPLKINALYDDKYSKMPNLERAREYERLFWTHPDSRLEERIITGYIAAGAFDSAKRFYREIRTMLDLEVAFSNNTGPQLWAIGFLQKDENLMATALEDSNTGSYRAMMLALWNCAVHGDPQGMERQMDDLVERYESSSGSESNGRVIKNFIPLIPALQDPQSPDHQKALDYFGKPNTGLVLRTLLILKQGMNTNDAIQFLGGPETDRFRHVVILYLLKDKEHMMEALQDYDAHTSSDVSWVMANWMARQTVEPNARVEDKDLKLPGAKTIAQAVREELDRP
ncbi:MAG TPA: hypothetical protein VMB80_08745 [Candidatus Acidoferrum sp.]|nr:hypothetical protein [Candidatus Acidoferrum sp.]